MEHGARGVLYGVCGVGGSGCGVWGSSVRGAWGFIISIRGKQPHIMTMEPRKGFGSNTPTPAMHTHAHIDTHIHTHIGDLSSPFLLQFVCHTTVIA